MAEGRRAMNQALYYLGRAARTKKQLRDYLEKKGHPEEIIDSTIARIEDYGYIDDSEYAESFVRQRSGLRASRRKLEGALVDKGVDRELAARTVGAISDDDELESARGWIRKWERQLGGLPERERRDKVYRRLAYRGFSWETIQRALDWKEQDDDQEP